jgi:hypothetical protein
MSGSTKKVFIVPHDILNGQQTSKHQLATKVFICFCQCCLRKRKKRKSAAADGVSKSAAHTVLCLSSLLHTKMFSITK